MSDPSTPFEQRAARRKLTWVAVLRGDEGALPASATSVEERIAVMKELAETGGALTGRPWPEYSREEMPGRIVRP